MARIDELLQEILDARYGSEVRQALHDAIEICAQGGGGGGGTADQIDYTKLLATIVERDTWEYDGITYTATEDCYICGGVATYSSNAGTPSKTNCYCVKIAGNIVGMVHTSDESSATSPVCYFLKKGQTMSITSGNSGMRLKAWLYAFGVSSGGGGGDTPSGDSIDVYSTTEKKCGVWIDGRDVYRKVETTQPINMSFVYKYNVGTVDIDNDSCTITTNVTPASGYEGVDVALTFDSSLVGKSVSLIFNVICDAQFMSSYYGYGCMVTGSDIAHSSSGFNIKDKLNTEFVMDNNKHSYKVDFTVTNTTMYLVFALAQIDTASTVSVTNIGLLYVDRDIIDNVVREQPTNGMVIMEYTKK